jgi:deoxyribose-phosphate aldolase
MIVNGAHCPNECPVIPQSVIDSLDSLQFSSLQEQRDEARILTDRVQEMHKAFVDSTRLRSVRHGLLGNAESYRAIYDDPCHRLNGMSINEKNRLIVTSEDARWALAHTDHTTLDPAGSEDRAFMLRLFNEHARAPHMKAVCAYPEKMHEILDLYRANPDKRIAIVVNFPHGANSPEEAANTIEREVRTLREAGLTNPIDVDTVVPYHAWMNGDDQHVSKVLQAEGEKARELGVTWKPIMKMSVHAYGAKNTNYGNDYFQSVYDLATLALEHGADAVKTCTGQAAREPFNHFVSADIAYTYNMMPMLMALRDFNAEHGTDRWPKISGGNRNAGDAAGIRYLCEELGLADKATIGAGYRFRPELVRFIREMEGPESPMSDEDLQPNRVNTGEIPQEARGLPPSCRA